MPNENLQHIRHSLAHLLAAAVHELYPEALPTIGPATESGFYYDFDCGETPLSAESLPAIEAKMRELLPIWDAFEREEVSEKQARTHFKNNSYKLELIDEIVSRNEPLTLYHAVPFKTYNLQPTTLFTDLCRGGHVEDASEIAPESFALSHIAGAYWRGDEKNKMLTRIYGIAFHTKDDLNAHLAMLEEAKKRDHKKLGRELDLFTFSETVGKGLPLWTHKGTTIRRELERFIVDEEIRRGYLHVSTPDIARLALYEKSGHYPHYKDSMYAPITIDDEKFMLRPMTCPHHYELYLRKQHSYRDLPVRIAEVAKLYRYEQSGELAGLQRVRVFSLADAHIICATEEQAGEEITGALDLIEYVAGVFGLKQGEHFSYRLSLGDRDDEKKYYKNDQAWDKGETLLRNLLESRNCRFYEAEKEAAFYGPKIDIQMKNVNGKEDTAFTVQYDFCMPDRFNLTYTDADGTLKRPFVVHRSSIGAIERIVAFLIEHYAGAFPLWLSPVQVRVLPIAETHRAWAREVYEAMREADIRAELDEADETLGRRIRAAKLEKLPYFLVIGEKEVASKTATLESRDSNTHDTLPIPALLEQLQSEIREKKHA
ncbi:MAG: threonine--tRNA ligase [bacterium]|nr:threonine--tRNA ligase [bacterium]MDZ4284499.1 threonine--tRNA ligase [Patescibacteria group bacterium]